jgi:hypothetical protein
MTTIAYRFPFLAADTLVTCQTHRDGHVVKIRKRGPYLASASGGLAASLRFLDWFATGLLIGKEPSMAGPDEDKYGACGHLFTPCGLIMNFSYSGWTLRCAPFYAAGSGSDYAYGAMAMGASAEEAVRAALQFETASGGEITLLRH